MSKTDFPLEALKTGEVSRLPTTVMTASGSINTTEEAIVCVKDLDMFVAVQLLEDTAAVPSLGKPCEENGSSHEWNEGMTPKLQKEPGKCDNFVPAVVLGRSGNIHLSSSAEESAESIKEFDTR